MESLEENTGNDVLEQLRQLPGIEIYQTSPTEIMITVKDKNPWNQSLSKLEAFWPLIKEAYEKEESEIDRQLDITFRNVDTVFVSTRNHEITGFSSIERHGADANVGIIRDIIVSRSKHGQGQGRELYEKIFSEPSFSAIISSTTTLAAVVNRMRVSGERGFQTYWGNMGSGNPEVERLRALDTGYLTSEKVLSDERLPAGDEGFSLTAPDYVLPIQEEAVNRLDPTSEIYAQALRMLELQKGYLNADGTPRAVVAGHLISIRNPQSQQNRTTTAV